MTAMSWHGHFSTVENIRERLHMKPSGAVLTAGTMWSIAESGATTGTIMTKCYNRGEKRSGREWIYTERRRGIEITQEILDKISHCIELGYSDVQTAELLGIHRTTLRNWKLTHDEIRRLYQSDGQDGDEERKKQVEEALLKRAIGYTQTEITRQVGKDGKLGVVKTVEKQVMPSTTAQIFWLKNRCGYEWDGGRLMSRTLIKWLSNARSSCFAAERISE